MANERIKENAKVTTEKVGQAITSAIKQNKPAIHKETVKQKIYVGPNLLGLPKYTIVESIDVPHIQSFIKDCPEIEKLFVAIDNMAETEERAKRKGTLEHRYYNKANEYKVEKAKKEKDATTGKGEQ